MKKLANISQFESLMNSTNNPVCQNAVFNDGGYWDCWADWHSYSEVPPVDPDDGWNYMRRTDPELFLECEMVSPDDGKNMWRLGNPNRFKANELVHRIQDMDKKLNEYKQEKRKQALQEEIDKKIEESMDFLVRGHQPYKEQDTRWLLGKIRESLQKEEEEKKEEALNYADQYWYSESPEENAKADQLTPEQKRATSPYTDILEKAEQEDRELQEQADINTLSLDNPIDELYRLHSSIMDTWRHAKHEMSTRRYEYKWSQEPQTTEETE